MTSPRKPGFVLPIAVTLAVLLGLYVGAYYAMVRPVFMYFMSDPPILDKSTPPEPEYEIPGVSIRGIDERVHCFFSPMNWLDHPHVWEPSR